LVVVIAMLRQWVTDGGSKLVAGQRWGVGGRREKAPKGSPVGAGGAPFRGSDSMLVSVSSVIPGFSTWVLRPLEVLIGQALGDARDEALEVCLRHAIRHFVEVLLGYRFGLGRLHGGTLLLLP
jgi:hypothetical protein